MKVIDFNFQGNNRCSLVLKALIDHLLLKEKRLAIHTIHVDAMRVKIKKWYPKAKVIRRGKYIIMENMK